MRRLFVSLAVASVVSVAVPSAAQRTARPAAADPAAKKKEGDDAFKSLRYADALRAYEESYTLSPNPALHFNRGRALEALERYPDAIRAFELFLRDAPPDLRAKAAALPEHVKVLEKKVAGVRFVVSPAGARVFMRGVALGTAPIAATKVNAGAARVEAEADGYSRYAREIDLPGGTETEVKIELVRQAATGAVASTRPSAGPAPAPAPDQAESSSVFSKWWFWTAAGVVVAGAATTVVILANKSPSPRSGDIGQLNAPLVRF